MNRKGEQVNGMDIRVFSIGANYILSKISLQWLRASPDACGLSALHRRLGGGGLEG